MRTTLTQAWEARGLTGMLLRSQVRGLLVRKFYEDKRRVRLARDAMIAFAFAVGTAIGSYAILPVYFEVIPLVDISRTLEFLLITSMVVGLAMLLVVVALAIVVMARDLAAVGNIDRYIFQHRDDEVEL